MLTTLFTKYRKFVVALILGPGLSAAAHFLGANSWDYFEIIAALTALGVVTVPNVQPPVASKP
jgi:hypothetical protein